MTSEWRPCCGKCRSENLQLVPMVSTRQASPAEKLAAGFDSGSLMVVADVKGAVVCADCGQPWEVWDGSELTAEEAAKRPSEAAQVPPGSKTHPGGD